MSFIEIIKQYLLKLLSSQIFSKLLVIFVSLVFTLTFAFSKVFENIKNRSVQNLAELDSPKNEKNHFKSKLDNLFVKSVFEGPINGFPLSLNSINNNRNLLLGNAINNNTTGIYNTNNFNNQTNKLQESLENSICKIYVFEDYSAK